MEFKDELKKVFLQNGIEVSPIQAEKFEKYYLLLVEWNQKFNLTTITSQTEVIEKHFLDSVISSEMLRDNSRIIDIGAGAGFPSLPLKIMNESLEITLIDSVNKKVTFLNEVIRILQFKNVEALHTRAEDLATKQEYREKFDFCVSRAVASLNTLSEYALPFLKIGGKFLAYKSSEIEEELENAKNAIKILGGKTKQVIHKKINSVDRTIIEISKILPSATKYPRGKNKPRTNPL